MISSVSSISFKANPQVAQDPISRVGTYTKQPEDVAPKKKNHKALKIIAGVVAGAIIVAGALIYGSRDGRWFKKLAENVENAKFMEKVGDKLATVGEWLDTNAWKPVVGFIQSIGKKGEEAGQQAAEA